MGGKRARIAELDDISMAPDFWNDQAAAQTLLKEKGGLERLVREFAAVGELVEEATTVVAGVVVTMVVARARMEPPSPSSARPLVRCTSSR